MEEKDPATNGDDMAGMQGHDHSTMGMAPKPSSDQEAKSTFTVTPERQQLIGIKTEPVEMRNMDKQIRTVGKVTLDESKIYNL